MARRTGLKLEACDSGNYRFSRPWLEGLEKRLPLGDTLLGFMSAASLLRASTCRRCVTHL